MANTNQAKKRVRQAEKARLHNVSMRSKVRTFIKKVIRAIEKGDVNAAKTAYKLAVPLIDGMVNKKIIAKNAAARHKSRLNNHIKKLSLSSTTNSI